MTTIKHEDKHEDEDVINYWLDLADAPKNLPKEYAQFFALWEAFNRWLRVRFVYECPSCGHRLGDGELVMKPGSEEHYQKLFQELLPPNGYRDKLRELKRLCPIKNGRGRSISITEPYQLGNTLKVLYTIRCNLFHGGKSGTSRDLEIVKAAYYVLKPFLKKAWGDTLKASQPEG